MAELYWIRTPEMTDMFSQGYIGMSTISAKRRWIAHKATAKIESKAHLPIYRAFRKYGVDGLVLQVLVQGPDEYITDLEIKLRPSPGIGWNCAMGGQDTGKGRKQSIEEREKRSASSRGRKMSDEARRNMSKASKGVPKSDAHKQKCRLARLGKPQTQAFKDNHSKKMLGRSTMTPAGKLSLSTFQKNLPPWARSRSTPLWRFAIEAYDFSKSAPVFSQRYLAKHFKVDDCVVTKIYRMLKSGWNPSEDPLYLAWLEDYKQKECNESTYATQAPCELI